MNSKKRVGLLFGAMVVLALIAVVVLSRQGKSEKPAPSEQGYYTGVMKNKGGKYSTEDKLAKPPLSATQSNSEDTKGTDQ